MQRPAALERLLYLDGLRGIAALVVYFGHFAAAFFPAMIFGRQNWLHVPWEKAFYTTPLGIFMNGNFAVHLFLALSAFVMLRKVYTSPARFRIMALVGRYLRLMLPVAASTVIAFILLRLSAGAFAQAGELSFSPWLANTWPVTSSFWAALREGVWDALWTNTANYNGVLWMLHFIWYGSIVAFAIGAFVRWPKLRVLLYVCGLLLTMSNAFAAFWVGALLYHFHQQLRSAFQRIPHSNFFPVAFLILGVTLGSVPAVIGDIPSAYSFLVRLGVPYFNVNNFIHIFSTSFIFIAVLASPQLQRVLSAKFFVSVGRVAFSLYLLHIVLIASLASWLLIQFTELPYVVAAGWTFLVTSVALGAAAVLFHRYVEKPAERFARWVASM